MLHGQPVVAGGSLLLELTLEHDGDVPETEGADGGPADGVRGRAKYSVDNRINFIAVITLQIRIINLILVTTSATNLY